MYCITIQKHEDYEQTYKIGQSLYAVENEIFSSMNDRPWYFTGGKLKPIEDKKNYTTNRRLAKLFPEESRSSDRIENQLMFVPPGYEKYRASAQLKMIFMFEGWEPWNVTEGRNMFSSCPVNTCKITRNLTLSSKADLVLCRERHMPNELKRLPNQLYMLHLMECPYHTFPIYYWNLFNWISTYRSDSDIADPYFKWQYYDPNVKQLVQERNYALNKTKKVAWFVSNCNAKNGRLEYAHELAKHIQVDIYGACGPHKCPRSTSEFCFEILESDYKFYLAFENSNCKEYITEKFFINSLTNNVLPIVMGAPPEDYEIAAPYHSYIHVEDFASAKQLADYLHILDGDDELYNSYFMWKGTGELINTHFMCRLCAMLHDDIPIATHRKHTNLKDWWHAPGICTNDRWRNSRVKKSLVSKIFNLFS